MKIQQNIEFLFWLYLLPHPNESVDRQNSPHGLGHSLVDSPHGWGVRLYTAREVLVHDMQVEFVCEKQQNSNSN